MISLVSFGQTNPEDIIVVRDVTNQTEKIILKSELSSDLDSLSMILMDEKREELLSKKEPTTISQLLIGSWKKEHSKRVNGKHAPLLTFEKITFKKNETFKQVAQGVKAKGKWTVKNNPVGNLRLQYNQTQTHIKDKDLLKLLPEEHIKAMSYDSNVLSVKEITETKLVMISFVALNGEHQFFRMVLTTYSKVE
jgi:hypothetical protein